MSETTPNLHLPYIMPAQAQKHVTHNEAIRALDAVVQLTVASRSLTAPPSAPVEGLRYIVAPGATGAWSGAAGKIAAFQDGAWAFHMPGEGWLAWVRDESLLCVFDEMDWTPAIDDALSINPAPLVGVNATADTTNRLSVSAPASLFNHAGSDHRQKINKAAVSNTASQLYQTGFSGRAELGLTGDDDFHLKVSADGSTWNEAMVVDRTTGAVAFPCSDLGGVLGNPWSGKKWAALGTSITSQSHYTAPLAALLSLTLVNLGASGGHLSVPTIGGGGLEIYDQITDIPGDADLVTLEAGINDFLRASVLGTPADTTTATFYGALYKAGTDILAANPLRTLAFFTPYSTEAGVSADWDTPNANANTLVQFQQAVRDVAQRLGCPLIDTGGESGISAQTASIYLSDGLHLNSAGGQRFAQFACDRLRTVHPPLPQAASPSFAPSAGSYGSSQSVTLACTTPGAAIHYTTDGTTPDASSSAYSGPLSIGVTTTVKAIAIAGVYRDSAVASATYTIGAGFSPADLLPAAWWDASDLGTLWQDTGATTPVTADGQPVARVNDRSGAGRTVTQGTSDARPAYHSDGSKHWLLFDGVDDALALASSYTTPDGNWCVAYASRKSVAEAFHGVVTGLAAGNWIGDRVLDTSQPDLQANNSSTVSGGFALASALEDHVVVANTSGGTCTLYQNRTEGGSASGITTLSSNGMSFSLTPYQYGGRIYQLIIIARALTSPEIADLTNWLKDKAGVA